MAMEESKAASLRRELHLVYGVVWVILHLGTDETPEERERRGGSEEFSEIEKK